MFKWISIIAAFSMALWPVGCFGYTYDSSFGSVGTGDGQFVGPVDLTLVAQAGGQTLLYVLDSGNCNIQSFTLTGSFQSKWGSNG